MSIIKRTLDSWTHQTFTVVFLVGALIACDSSKNQPINPQVPGAANTPRTRSAGGDYMAVAPIIQRNCAGSSCHSNGSSMVVLVGNQSNVDAYKPEIYSVLLDGSMPPFGAISNSDRSALLNYTK